MTPEEAEAFDALRERMMRRCDWELCICWFPRWCWITGEWFWFGRHWRLTYYPEYALDTEPTTYWIHLNVGTQIKLML